MSFRNIKFVVPIEQDCTKFVVLKDDKFVDVNLDESLPSSNEYTLGDLLASGQRVVPVETAILHDEAIASHVVSSLINSTDSSDVSDQ